MATLPWWEEEPTADETPVMISMLEHFSYCPRQCALIHLEQCYDDNVFTLKGSQGHERVDESVSGIQNGVRFERALPLFSRKLNLTGKADLIEFPAGIPYPVEYKHGSRGGRGHAEVQLCAQAMCLEEMFGVAVSKGAIYALTTHRRYEVAITDSLREQTLAMIHEVHEMLKTEQLPPAVNDRRCPNCSLIDICRPETFAAENQQKLQSEWLRSRIPEEEV